MTSSTIEHRAQVPGETLKQRKPNACLSALSPSALALLKPHLVDVFFPEGATLWDADRAHPDIYFPASGLISICVAMLDGGCIQVGCVGREGAAGPIFDPAPDELLSRGSIQISGHFTRIPVAALLAAAKDSHEIANLIACCRDWIFLQAQRVAACNAAHAAERRLCRWLMQCSQQIDTDTIPFTQEMMAAVLGLRRTTVTLIAQTLQEQGSIRYRRGKVAILDRSRLREHACECCDALDQKHWPSNRLSTRGGSREQGWFRTLNSSASSRMID